MKRIMLAVLVLIAAGGSSARAQQVTGIILRVVPALARQNETVNVRFDLLASAELITSVVVHVAYPQGLTPVVATHLTPGISPPEGALADSTVGASTCPQCT